MRHSLSIEPLHFVDDAHVLLNSVRVFINGEIILVDSERFMSGRLPVDLIEGKLFAVEEGCDFVDGVVSRRVEDSERVELKRHLVEGQRLWGRHFHHGRNVAVNTFEAVAVLSLSYRGLIHNRCLKLDLVSKAVS